MDVVVVVGAGLIGQAIARRVGPGKKIILADLRQAHADAAVETFLNGGFDAEAATVDVRRERRPGDRTPRNVGRPCQTAGHGTHHAAQHGERRGQ